MLPIDQLTYSIIGCAMRIHTSMGNGFQEVIYQRCLEMEFELAKITFEREKEMPIYYLGKSVSTRRVDFLVSNIIVVELKAVEQLLAVHYAQAINYCEAYHIRHGLLINFGSIKLEFKRVYNKKLLPSIS